MHEKVDEILEYLDYIKSQRRVVSIVRTFMGVSFSVEVNIVSVSKKYRSVVVANLQQQNISLLPFTEVTIHSDLFPRPIRTKVSQVDPTQHAATLQPFDYIQLAGENRAHMRVHPKQGMIAKIVSEKGEQYFAEVDDISIEGISIILDKRVEKLETALVPQSSIILQFSLTFTGHPSNINLNLTATITYLITLNGDEKTKIGVLTYPNEEERSALRRYIFDRQTEIFNEINAPQKNNPPPKILI